MALHVYIFITLLLISILLLGVGEPYIKVSWLVNTHSFICICICYYFQLCQWVLVDHVSGCMAHQHSALLLCVFITLLLISIMLIFLFIQTLNLMGVGGPCLGMHGSSTLTPICVDNIMLFNTLLFIFHYVSNQHPHLCFHLYY